MSLLIGMGLLIWLRWFLDRPNGGRSWQADGRLVLAAIGYWLVLGIPTEMLLFMLRLGVDPVKALGLGLKEAMQQVARDVAVQSPVGSVASQPAMALRFQAPGA